MTNMPEVKNCSVQECFYNAAEWCHAPAINVGSGHPVCDTFIFRNEDHGMPADIGMVGACHMYDCKWNDTLSCHAPSINVDRHMGHPDCVTFDPRPDLEQNIDIQVAEEAPEVESTGSRAMRLSGPQA